MYFKLSAVHMQNPYSFRSEPIRFSVLVPHVENLAAVELEPAGGPRRGLLENARREN